MLIETANGSRWKRWVDPDSGRTETLVETLAKGDERTAIIALGITPHVDEYFDGLDHQPGAEREHSPNQYTRRQDPPPTADEILERIQKRIENAFRDTDPSTERSRNPAAGQHRVRVEPGRVRQLPGTRCKGIGPRHR